jgi:3D-(3,5/4)-trihydroxycyclohexane-1,2-dione acylhydrolase (decyclizing)
VSTVRCTTAEAVVRFLVAQKTMIDGEKVQLFPGVYGIFGHGNVTSLALALREVRDVMPTWRGQNEQGMALAAVAFAKASKRKRIMVATSSVGPGATNMVTAAGVAMSNRLPVLLLSGDTFSSRLPDPVLQQVEHFGDPTITVNDAFKPVVRYWDRITSPEQIVASLPQAVRTMLDPATCGPAFIGLPQDVQAEAWDYPTEFFDEVVHEIARPRADVGQLHRAAMAIRGGQGLPDGRPSPQLRTHRHHRVHVGQRTGGRGRRGDRGRQSSAGLHHGVVDGLRGRRAIRRCERGGL